MNKQHLNAGLELHGSISVPSLIWNHIFNKSSNVSCSQRNPSSMTTDPPLRVEWLHWELWRALVTSDGNLTSLNQKQNNKKSSSLCIFFFFFPKVGNIFCTGTNYISSFDQKISLKVFSSYISVNTDVRVSVSGANVVVVQGEVIREFLYRKRRRRRRREKEGRGDGQKVRRSWRRESLYSLYLLGKMSNAQSKWTGEKRAWLLLRW